LDRCSTNSRRRWCDLASGCSRHRCSHNRLGSRCWGRGSGRSLHALNGCFGLRGRGYGAIGLCAFRSGEGGIALTFDLQAVIIIGLDLVIAFLRGDELAITIRRGLLAAQPPHAANHDEQGEQRREHEAQQLGGRHAFLIIIAFDSL
jgi:hypothetical protein